MRLFGTTSFNLYFYTVKTIAILLLPVFLNAQGAFSPRTLDIEPTREKYNWKRAILPASLCFVAGAAWGTNQTLVHHNAEFFRVFPNANPRFWGPDSWRNKYTNFNPENGRTVVPVWFTDGQHLTASATQVLVFGAGVSIGIGRPRKWWHYAADAGISFAAYSLGNCLTYNVIFR